MSTVIKFMLVQLVTIIIFLEHLGFLKQIRIVHYIVHILRIYLGVSLNPNSGLDFVLIF